MNVGSLPKILRSAQAILFDFDGPVCSVFAGFPATQVARDMRSQLKQLGIELPSTNDPLELLRLAVPLGHDAVHKVEDLLIEAEKTAVRTAVPTPGGEESIRACTASGRLTAVVSNNSAAAVLAYLSQRQLQYPAADLVIGRRYAEPGLMKPHPAPIQTVLARLSVEPSAAVLVGDTITDIEAAAAAGVASIGYANKPGKRAQFDGASAVVDDMRVLAEQLALLANGFLS